jgi:hypothetical protein
MKEETYLTDLSAAAWAILVPLLPPPQVRGRPREHGWHSILEAIF